MFRSLICLSALSLACVAQEAPSPDSDPAPAPGGDTPVTGVETPVDAVPAGADWSLRDKASYLFGFTQVGPQVETEQLIAAAIRSGIEDGLAGEQPQVPMQGAQELFQRWQQRDKAAVPAEPAPAADDPGEWTDRRQISYLFGYAPMVRTIRQAQFNPDKILTGFDDAVADNAAAVPAASAETVLAAYQQEMQAAQQKAAAANLEAGKAYLAETAEKEGVTATESGLLYEVLKPGDGPQPAATDTVRVHYTGTLIDGTVFDSSEQRGEPISFQLNGVIPGWTEGLQLMPAGARYRFHIPPALGYGPRPAGKIPPNSVLVFEVELLGIE